MLLSNSTNQIGKGWEGSSWSLPKPTVEIPYEVNRKILHWCRRTASRECSGMGKLKIEDGVIKVIDCWMVKQINSGSQTEMDGDSIAKLYYDKREIPGEWKFWWHSHGTMSVFWSGTDMEQIRRMAGNGMCLAIVFNAAGERKACVAINDPFPFSIDDINVNIVDHISDATLKQWDNEYDSAVIREVERPSSITYGDGFYGYEDNFIPAYARQQIERSDDRQTEKVNERNVRVRWDELLTEEELLESVLSLRQNITVKVCECLGIRYENELTLDSVVSSTRNTHMSSIDFLVKDKLKEIDEEMNILMDIARSGT